MRVVKFFRDPATGVAVGLAAFTGFLLVIGYGLTTRSEEWLQIIGGGLLAMGVLLSLLTVYVLIQLAREHVLPAKGPTFHWPISWARSTDRHQWLFDIAQHDAENPQGELRILAQTVCNFDASPESRSPWIEVEYEFYNGGVHTILLGPVKGEVVFLGKGTGRFPIEEVKGRHRVPRGGADRLRIKVFLTPDVMAEIFQKELRVEVSNSFRRMRSLSFSGLQIEVESEPPEGWAGTRREIKLGSHDTFLVGDSN